MSFERGRVMDEENREHDAAVAVERPAGWFSNAPWWMVSAGIHMVFLLGATLVAMDSLHHFDDIGCPIIVRPPSPPDNLFTNIPQPETSTGQNSAPIDDANATVA